MLSDLSLLLLLLLGANSNCKPLDDSSSVNPNEINFGSRNDGDKKKLKDEIDATESWDIPRPFARLSNDGGKTSGEKIQLPPVTQSPILSAEITETAPGEIGSGKSTAISPSGNSTTDNKLATRQQGVPWILAPFSQKVQFSPQTFFQERIDQLKDTLTNIASIFPNQQDAGTKQFGNIAGLANLIGQNDSGFYTDRLDPVGFFGGNGWFANKGGILGGPGAFISTGSLFTDYPTPYKK